MEGEWIRELALCIRKKPQPLHPGAERQPHIHRPSQEEEGANQAGDPPPPLPFPLCLLDGPSRSAPLHIRWDRPRPSRGAGRQGGEAGRAAGCSTPAAPLSLSAVASQHGSPHIPPLSRTEPSARSAAPYARSLPSHSRTPEGMGGDRRKTAAPPPAQPPSGTPPPRYVSRGRLTPLLSAPSSRTHRAADSRPCPAPAARRWVKP